MVMLETLKRYLGTGWVEADETWTYASADDPTFTFTVAADVTTKYSAGMRIKLTQTTVKYFIITAVSTYSGGNTTITVYGGTDYDLTDAAITANYYSTQKAPQGFPLSPAKWQVVITSTTATADTSTTTDWLNLGSHSITVPIGVWNLGYSVHARSIRASTNPAFVKTTLSTGNNSETNTKLSCVGIGEYPVNPNTATKFMVKESVVVATSKTVYYLNIRSEYGNTYLQIRNEDNPMFITATCAYL